VHDLIPQLRERSRGWEGWRERKEELGRNGKEDGRQMTDGEEDSSRDRWMDDEEKWILG